jgi:hypothetical protein
VNPREQGDIGERSAAAWLLERGHGVFIPFGHSPDFDLVAEVGGELLRVQVKTCTRRQYDRWCVTLCTRGGNRSWNGIVKRFAAARCDYLFVLTGDGRRWFIPAGAVGGGTAIVLGGPKYARYEVETGAPIVGDGD